MRNGARPIPIAERLPRFYRVADSGCWLWTRHVNACGYGVIKSRGRLITASRAAYETWVGPIPKGLCVLHRCDVRSCINPEHLFLGTLSDNAKDAAAKGRLAIQRPGVKRFTGMRHSPETRARMSAARKAYLQREREARR